jgi:hypothetical protein
MQRSTEGGTSEHLDPGTLDKSHLHKTIRHRAVAADPRHANGLRHWDMG